MSEETAQLLMIRFTDAVQELEGQNQFFSSDLIEKMRIQLEEKIKLSDASSRSSLVLNLYKVIDILVEWQNLYKRRKKRTIPASKWFVLRTIKLRLSKILLKLVFVSDATPQIVPGTSTTADGGLADDHQIAEGSNTPGTYGFDIEMEKIVALLQKGSDGAISPIGIVGIAGSGKTTLARLVYNDDRVKKEFMPRIWVNLSGKADSKLDFTTTIVQYLLKQLCEEDDVACNTSLEDQLVTLYKHLSGKKYLIVFDGVWHINSWYDNLVKSRILNEGREIFGGLSKEPGGRIIITSKLQAKTKETIGVANVYEPPMLDRDSCWSIFTDVLNKHNLSLEPAHTKMKDEFLDNCNGHPAAAKRLAHIFCFGELH